MFLAKRKTRRQVPPQGRSMLRTKRQGVNATTKNANC